MSESRRIIILGAGTVGSHISDLLQKERHRVVMIDTDKARLKDLSSRLDIQTLSGNGTDASVLLNAGVAEADVFLALTDLDEVNMVSSFIAKKLGAASVVARARATWLRDKTPLDLAATLGIDLLMNPEYITAQAITRFVDNPDALALTNFAHGRVQLRSFVMDEESELAGKRMKEIKLPENVLVVTINHEGEVIVPRGETQVNVGDKVTIIGVPAQLPLAQNMFHTPIEKLRNIVIAGGGNTGLYLAQALEKRNFHVTIIESDEEVCNFLSEKLSHTEVVNGDATNKGLLKEERINKADILIAVTGDDEDNLMCCLLAKEFGVAQTVVRIARPDYASLVSKLGIDLALSPRHVMAERVLTLVSRGRVRAVALLENAKVEVNELVAEEGSRLTGVPLKDMPMPQDALIAAIVHRGETIVPRGNHQIEAGDTVIAIGMRSAMDSVEAGFRGA